MEQAKKEKPVKITKVLEDFSTSLIMLKKRAIAEMRTHEEKIALSKNMSPSFEIKAAFDNEMKFSLRPVIFLKLLKIGDLVAEPPKPDAYYIKKMRKKEKQK